MRRMPLTDAFFLIGESRRTPMHVGGLNLFTLPEGADETRFLANLAEVLRYDGELRRPFGEKLKSGALGVAGPMFWEEDHLLDMDYHIRHSALPKPGRFRELFALVSRLHSALLDRSRPLWEMHLIEGLQDRQFATYFKAHHCAIDGVGAMHIMSSMYTPSARNKVRESPFSYAAYEQYKAQLAGAKERRIQPREDEMRAVTELLREQLGGTLNVAKALQQYAGVWMGKKTSLAVPFHKMPKSSLSGEITGARRFVAQSWDLQRVRMMGKAFDGTLNDAVLAMCGGALRRYLQDHQNLPKEPLKAMAPISLRTEGDIDSANAVGFLTANLGTNERDPARRMRVVRESMQAGKDQLKGMSRREVDVYTMITQAPMVLSMLTGMASRFPAFSTVVSNVPGPREQRYWNGASLDGMYPVSIPFDGFPLNITLVSNADKLDFGIVACRRSVPQVQRIIDYMEEALVELEEAAGLRSSGTRRSGVSSGTATKAPARRKAKTDSKSTKAAARARPAGKSKAKAKVKRKAQAKARPKTNVKAKAKAKPKPKPKPKAKAKPKNPATGRSSRKA